MSNYFNTLPLRVQLEELGKCRFMEPEEFANGVDAIKDKKIVIVGCGAQGLNQGLNLRDSGLDVSYALRESAITEQRASFLRATENGFTVGSYEELIPQADMVLNLTPDKQHTDVVTTVQPLMKHGACLSYSHGFNIVEEGMQVNPKITVVMMCPKCPGQWCCDNPHVEHTPNCSIGPNAGSYNPSTTGLFRASNKTGLVTLFTEISRASFGS